MQYMGIISLGVTILIHIITAVIFFTKMGSRLKSLEKEVAELVTHQESAQNQSQEAIDDIWSAMTLKFDKIFQDYITTKSAVEFFKKRGDK